MSEIKTLHIYISRGKAYIPLIAKSDVGVYFEIEPIQIVDLKFDDLLVVIRHALNDDSPIIPHPSLDEQKVLAKPMLTAAKVRSYKQFVQTSRLYSIWQYLDRIELHLFERVKKGTGYYSDLSQALKFSLNSDLSEIVRALLADIKEHPELLS
jgi:hypothetical protein